MHYLLALHNAYTYSQTGPNSMFFVG